MIVEDLRTARSADRGATRVGDVMREVSSVEPSADAFDTLAVLNQFRNSIVVVKENGEPVGVLSRSDYAHALTIQRGFRSTLNA